MVVPLTGYMDRFSARPGERLAVKVSSQLAGPYRWWHHEHRFEPVDGGTRVIDHVEFLPRMNWVTGWMVQRDVARIFSYREQIMKQIFG